LIRLESGKRIETPGRISAAFGRKQVRFGSLQVEFGRKVQAAEGIVRVGP